MADTAMRDAQSEYEADVVGTTTCDTRKAYSAGKQLAQKRNKSNFGQVRPKQQNRLTVPLNRTPSRGQ